jgi:Protein of unknown function (DUF3352)
VSSTLPPSGGPEYLEVGGGGPLPPSEPSSGRGGRRLLVGGVVVAALAVGGGAAWALTSFFSSGPQPAEVLPATTVGYASIDLDPSGSQKIEAVRMLRKFPSFREDVGLDTDDDVRRAIWDRLGVEDECPGLSYTDDVEPWLGDRFAVAAVDTGGDTSVSVGVLQVTDEGAADAALQQLRDCSSGGEVSGPASGGWVFSDGWAVIAEDEQTAQQVVDAADDGTLAADDTYQQWMDEVGDAGIASAYVAPAAGEFMADSLQGMGGLLGPVSEPGTFMSTEEADSAGEAAAEADQALRDFEGLAMTVRFSDGALEMEMAGDPGLSVDSLYSSDRGADMVQTLPDSTAIALGAGFEDGWVRDVADQAASVLGGDPDELLAEAGAGTGLDLPDDVETLSGDSFALSVDSDFDPDALFGTGDTSSIPVAAKIQGDPDGVESVLDKLRSQIPPPDGEALIPSDSAGDVTVVGLSSDYNSEVLGDGGLGESDVFRNVVREADQASAVIFVNFDAGNGWLDDMVDDGDPGSADDVAVLQGFGMSVWGTDGAAHAVLRLTTD